MTKTIEAKLVRTSTSLNCNRKLVCNKMVQPESQNFWKIWPLRKTIVIGKLLIEPFYEEVLTYSPGGKTPIPV